MNSFELYCSIRKIIFSVTKNISINSCRAVKCIFVFLVFYGFVFNIYHIFLKALFVLENLEAHAVCRNIIVLWKGDVPITYYRYFTKIRPYTEIFYIGKN